MGIDCPSFTKINIGLKILGQRNDGFHNITTIFQELQFGDNISIVQSGQGCNIISDVDWIPSDKKNICYKAYEELIKKFPDLDGIKIIINKNVPVGSGLGGGSANAAAVLKGVCKLYDLGISNNELKQIALKIGADVPFFIEGGTQLGKGVGEILKPINNPVKGFYLLVIPDISISTQWAYSKIKNKLNCEETLTNFAGFYGEKKFSPELFENDFERVVIPTYPEIGSIKEKLIEFGAMFASLSGSGSTVYGIFSDDSSAKEAELFFQDSNMTILTEPT